MCASLPSTPSSLLFSQLEEVAILAQGTQKTTLSVPGRLIGLGQFRPGDVANPNIRKVGTLEHVEEVRVEKCCMGEEVTKKSVAALKR